jgi:hypothetical protein
LKKALDVFSIWITAQEMIFSLDCMYLQSGLNFGEEFSTFFVKVLAFAVFPIFLGVLSAALWTLFS